MRAGLLMAGWSVSMPRFLVAPFVVANSDLKSWSLSALLLLASR
jgi:hypothetical protein